MRSFDIVFEQNRSIVIVRIITTDKDVVIVVPTTDIDVDAVHGKHKEVHYTFRPELIHVFDKATEKNLF